MKITPFFVPDESSRPVKRNNRSVYVFIIVTRLGGHFKVGRAARSSQLTWYDIILPAGPDESVIVTACRLPTETKTKNGSRPRRIT